MPFRTARPRRDAGPSREQMAEALAAMETLGREDFWWCCEHLLWIKTEESPLQRFTPIDTQRYIVEKYLQPGWDNHEPVALVILKSRRARISTIIEAWAFHKARFYPGQAVLIAAHLDRSVDELFQMILRFHQHLPPELQPRPKSLNRKELAYEGLDSSISVVPARYMDISRGQLININHIAEAPRLPAPDVVMAGLSEAIPSRGRSCWVLEGTADEASLWFKDFWYEVKRNRYRQHLGGRRWRLCFVPWFAHPDYWLPVPRGFQPTEEEADLQKLHGLTTPQLVWWRMKLAEMEMLHPGRGRYYMGYEHPSTDAEAFAASGSTIFPPEYLDPLKAHIKPPSLGFHFERAGTWQWTLRPGRPLESPFQVWEAPKAGCQYAIGSDVSAGTGRHQSTIVVVRMPGFVQVATWGDNETSPADLAGLIACVARYYAGAGRGLQMPIVNIDITGGWGADTNSRLSDFYSREPFELYIWEAFDRLAPAEASPASRTGWLFTWVSKNILISTALNLMRERLCQIPSEAIQDDLRNLTEEHLNRRLTIEMSGADLAVGYLLAIVAAWRKIARWSWPQADVAGLQEEQPPPRDVNHDAMYDTTLDELQRPGAKPGQGSTAGDRDVPWMTQW